MTAKNTTRTARTARTALSFFLREKKGSPIVSVKESPAPSLTEVRSAGSAMYAVAADFLLRGPREELVKNSWGDQLKSERTFYLKLCKHVKPEAACKAWNALVESADRRRDLSLSGLVRACKAAGLFPAGTAPAPKAEAQPDDGGESACMALADAIVAILSGKGNPATKLAAIRALPDIKDAMDRAADA